MNLKKNLEQVTDGAVKNLADAGCQSLKTTMNDIRGKSSAKDR